MEELQKAGFLMRLMAWLIDVAAIAILSFVVVLLFSGVVTIGERSDSGIIDFFAAATALLLAGVSLVLQFLYFGFLWSRDGQTFGMKAANIRVVRQDGVTFPSFMRSGLRGSVGYWISGLIFWLGYLWALFDSNSEAWHDKIFDTWVVVPSPFEVKS